MKATSNNRKARGAPRRRSLVIALAVALIAAVAPSLTASVGAADPAKPVSMRLLVIAADGNETDYPAITTFLDEVDTPDSTIDLRPLRPDPHPDAVPLDAIVGSVA